MRKLMIFILGLVIGSAIVYFLSTKYIFNYEIFNSTSWSAFGAFFSIIAIFCVYLLIELISFMIRNKTEYKIVNDFNNGIPKISGVGYMSLDHGTLIESDPDKYDVKYRLWGYNKDTEKKNGTLFYGPYSTFILKQGNYIANFRIRVFNLELNKTADRDDYQLLRIDVNHVSEISKDTEDRSKAGKEDNTMKIERTHRILADDYITYKIIKKHASKWFLYQIEFYTDLIGRYEFRLNILDGKSWEPDNIQFLKEEYLFLFDSVIIKEKKQFKIPWA
jgi:hypothetical protein